MTSEDELKYQLASAVSAKIVEEIAYTHDRMMRAMVSQNLNPNLCQISHLIVWNRAKDGIEGYKIQPVPYYKGKPWPTNTSFHERVEVLAGFGGKTRGEVFFDHSAQMEAALEKSDD